MTETRIKLGQRGDVEAVRALLDLSGLKLVDVGCGPGRTTRDLAAAGAQALGVEPDPIQAELNRKAEPVAGVSFVQARAEALPVVDASMDGVLFFRSLHHVPLEAMDAALVEAARVLRQGDGFLMVVEPSMEGSHFPVMRPFNDETTVRTAAQAALARTASTLFERCEAYSYIQYPTYGGFEEMVARFTGQTFNNISRADVETDQVRALFEKGCTPDGVYRFEQPMLLNLYRRRR